MKAEELALVQGWADTRRALARWNRKPLARPVAVDARRARRHRRCCWPRSGSSPRCRRPTRRGACLPRRRRPPTAAATSRSCSTATRSCWRCTRSPASPASSPARRCRRWPSGYSGLWRRVHERAGPLAIGFVVARDAVLARHPGLRPRPRRRRPRRPARHVAALLLLGLLPHALPELTALFLPLAAWTLAAAAALGGAAGRDLRHRRRSRSRCWSRRGDRDVG